MSKIARDTLYHRHRFPAEIIAHAVWLAVIRFSTTG
jgi:putative transposase